MNQRPKLYLIAGANATFKSTFAPLFVRNTLDTTHIDFDEVKNVLPKSVNIDEQVAEILETKETDTFLNKKDIAFQSNLLDPNDLFSFQKKAKDNDYDFDVIFLSTTNIQQNIFFNHLRGDLQKHRVSNYTIELSLENSLTNIKNNLGKFDSLTVYDVTIDFFKNMKVVNKEIIDKIGDIKLLAEPIKNLEIRNDRLLFKKEILPVFAQEIFDTYVGKLINLTPTQEKKVLDSLTKKHFYYKTNPTDTPILHIVGGQPGAGKNKVSNKIIAASNNSVFYPKIEDFRAAHPNVSLLKEILGNEFIRQSVNYVNQLNNRLMNLAKDKHVDIIMETSFTDPNSINSLINQAKNNGYMVEVHVLAINEKFSFLNTRLKEEILLKTEPNIETTSKDMFHNLVGAIPKTLEKVVDNNGYDYIHLYKNGLEGFNLPSEEIPIIIVESNSNNILKKFDEEVNRKWSMKSNQVYTNLFNRVYGKMRERAAPLEDLVKFKKDNAIVNQLKP